MKLREKGWAKDAPPHQPLNWQLPETDSWAGVELHWALGDFVHPVTEEMFREYVEKYEEDEK